MLQSIELDRIDDHVYSATTAVISSVMTFTQTATDKNAQLYVPLVKVRRNHSEFHLSCFSERIIKVWNSLPPSIASFNPFTADPVNALHSAVLV